MRESERPGKVIEYLMLAGNVFLGLVVLELIVHGLVDYADATFLFQTQKKPVLALLCLFMTAFLLLVFSVCRRLTENLTLRKAKMVSALLLVPAFALQIYMLFYYRSSYLFDNAFVTGGASALAMDGQVAKEAVYYLSVYPNQNAYAVLTAVLWKLGTAAGISRVYGSQFSPVKLTGGYGLRLSFPAIQNNPLGCFEYLSVISTQKHQ